MSVRSSSAKLVFYDLVADGEKVQVMASAKSFTSNEEFATFTNAIVTTSTSIHAGSNYHRPSDENDSLRCSCSRFHGSLANVGGASQEPLSAEALGCCGRLCFCCCRSEC